MSTLYWTLTTVSTLYWIDNSVKLYWTMTTVSTFDSDDSVNILLDFDYNVNTLID